MNLESPPVFLGVCGKFHAFHLATQFAERNRLGGLFAVDQRWAPPPHVPRALFHNRRDLKLWRLLSARTPVPLGHTLQRERRIFDRWLSKKLQRFDGGVFHGWNAHIARTLQSLDPTRWTRVVERSCPHNQFQHDLMIDESSRLGMEYRFDAAELESAIRELYDADIIVAPSSYSASSYADPILQRKVRINPLGGNYPYRERATKPPGLRVLLVGNAFLRKGTHYLIEAFKLVEDPAAELWIRGEVPSEYRGRIQDSRVKIIPPVSFERLNQLYQEATLFCLPSIDEGFGMVALEALSYGLPLIYTENCGVGDILAGRVGAKVPIRSPLAIATAIAEIRTWSDEEYLDFDGRRRAILQHATWRKCADRMLADIYVS